MTKLKEFSIPIHIQRFDKKKLIFLIKNWKNGENLLSFQPFQLFDAKHFGYIRKEWESKMLSKKLKSNKKKKKKKRENGGKV